MTESNIITIIKEMMEEVDDVIEKTGSEKKEYVLECIQSKFGAEIYDRYEPMINMTIDFIIDVSKGKTKLSLNHIRKKYCC